MLPAVHAKITQFERVVTQTAEYLIAAWPEQLEGVHVEVAVMPSDLPTGNYVDRWKVVRDTATIVLYRLPIQRLSRLHRDDEFHRRIVVESCVFHAFAEFMGREPWDLVPRLA